MAFRMGVRFDLKIFSFLMQERMLQDTVKSKLCYCQGLTQFNYAIFHIDQLSYVFQA